MLENGVTWFLLADGRRAKLFVEPRRGADLQARQDWTLEISEDELYDPQDRPPRSFDRAGAGRHAMDKGRSLHEQEEENFLKRLAERVSAAAKQQNFDHLVLAAPPRALGALRRQLPDSVRARIRAETDKDILDEDSTRLRQRLEELLRP